tara:strand:+ start:1456 stop:1560 length:105 start_codon:yes stop_codon:yes gene_type:complete
MFSVALIETIITVIKKCVIAIVLRDRHQALFGIH